MSSVSKVIILPGSKVRFFCKDGLSAIDVEDIKRIYHFGGKLEFVNCGPFNIIMGLEMAADSML